MMWYLYPPLLNGPHFGTPLQMRAQPNFQSNIGDRRRGHYENCNKTKGGGVGNKGNIDRGGRGLLVGQLPLGVGAWHP